MEQDIIVISVNRNGKADVVHFDNFEHAWQVCVDDGSATYWTGTVSELKKQFTIHNGEIEQEYFEEALEEFGVDENYSGLLLEYAYNEAGCAIRCHEGSSDWEDRKTFFESLIAETSQRCFVYYRQYYENDDDFAERCCFPELGIRKGHILHKLKM